MLKIEGKIDAPRGARQLLENLLRHAGVDLASNDSTVNIIDVSKGKTNLRGLENVNIREVCPNGVKIRFQTGDNTTGRVAVVYTPAGMTPEMLRERLIQSVASVQRSQPTKYTALLRRIFERYGFSELRSNAIWREIHRWCDIGWRRDYTWNSSRL